MVSRSLMAILAVCVLAGCSMFGGAATTGKVAENAGVLAIQCNVKGADVYVDNLLVGTIVKADSRQQFVVSAGEHDLQRDRDLLFHLLGRASWVERDHRHLGVGDVGESFDRQRLERGDAAADEKYHSQHDE